MAMEIEFKPETVYSENLKEDVTKFTAHNVPNWYARYVAILKTIGMLTEEYSHDFVSSLRVK